jgi:hypothetical protein
MNTECPRRRIRELYASNQAAEELARSGPACVLISYGELVSCYRRLPNGSPTSGLLSSLVSRQTKVLHDN